MFWIGFGAGVGASFLICMIALVVMICRLDKAVNTTKKPQEIPPALCEYWETCNGLLEEKIEVLKEISVNTRNIGR